MDPVKIGLVGYGRYVQAPLMATADVFEATGVSIERFEMQRLGAER